MIAVRRDGKLVYLGATGASEGHPHRIADVFPYASITKQVTALLIMQEVEGKRLALDAPVARFLPAAPPGLTTRQLLQHVSGLANLEAGTPEGSIPAVYMRGHVGTTQEEASTCLAGPTGPAGEFRYNNCDYIVLGALLEKVSGRPYASLVHERVRDKLGLTSWGVFGVDPPPAYVVAGHGDQGELAPRVNFATYGAAGALFGNASDLSRFSQALLDGELLGAAATEEMFRGDPKLQQEALGSWQYRLNGTIDLVERQGDIAGIRTLALLSRSERVAITILASTEKAPLFELWAQRGVSYDLVTAVASGKIRSADLEADLDILERAYRALHPGLLRYNTPAELDALFASTRAAFARDRSLGEAFVELTRLTAALRCGHSYPNPSNQPAEVAKALFEGPRVPFLFEWRDGAMMITRDFTGRLAPGTLVEAIASVPTATILARLLPLARADGHNDAKRVAYLAVTGESDHEAFDLLAPLVVPELFARPELALTIRGAPALTVPLQTAEARRAAIATPEPDPAAPLWKLEWTGATAYLAMPSWVAYHSKRDWRGDMRAILGEVVAKRARTLVVDLRGNEGGNDVGDEILARLIAKPLQRAAMHRRVRYQSVPAELRPYLDTWDPTFVDLGREASPVGDGWFEFPPEAGADVIEPALPRFTGKLVVLVDAANSSSTFQFALTVKQQKLGTLIGMPTGGSQRGINGGAFFFVRLPHSGIEVDLPLIGTFPTGDAPDAGVAPDIVVERQPSDVAKGLDPARVRAFAQ